MRTHCWWVPVAMAAALTGRLAVVAQEWQTVDDFSLGSGDAEAHGVAMDNRGGVYVVGTANGQAIIRYSPDGGTSWSTRDNFVYPPSTNHPSYTNNLFNAITITPQGDVFVGGASAAWFGPGLNAGRWIVRRSRDQGATWETVDDVYSQMIDPGHPGTNAAVYSLSNDRDGRVYGAGLQLLTGPSYPSWWVRRSDSGGTNWDTKLVVPAAYGGVSQLTCAGEDVYVTGTIDGGGPLTGLIVRSSDFGATWSTNFVDTDQAYPAITSDPGGNIYAAGIEPSSNSTNWLVRKAAPGGTNWTILDRSSYSGSPNSIAVNAARSICVAGRYIFYNIYTDDAGTHYDSNWAWVSRQYSVASGQWNTTDVFSYSGNPTNMHAAAMGTAIARDGTTFVAGYGSTESGQRHWVVRKQAAQPRLQIAFAGRFVTVSWPAAYTNSTLEWTDSAGASQLWNTFTGTVDVVGEQNTVTFDGAAGARLFRLKSATGF